MLCNWETSLSCSYVCGARGLCSALVLGPTDQSIRSPCASSTKMIDKSVGKKPFKPMWPPIDAMAIQAVLIVCRPPLHPCFRIALGFIGCHHPLQPSHDTRMPAVIGTNLQKLC
jgi:hypothetical protein